MNAIQSALVPKATTRLMPAIGTTQKISVDEIVAQLSTNFSTNIEQTFYERFGQMQGWHLIIIVSFGISVPLLSCFLTIFCICRFCLWKKCLELLFKCGPCLNANGCRNFSAFLAAKKSKMKSNLIRLL